MTDQQRQPSTSPYLDDREVRVDLYRIGPSGTSGRGPVVVGGFLAVLVMIVGLAVFGGRLTDGEPVSSAAALVSADPSASPSRPPRRTLAPTVPPELPGLPNDNLPGAPSVVIGMQRNDDLELAVWEPGEDAFSTVGRIPGVMARRPEEPANQDGYTIVDVAPRWQADGRLPLVAAVRIAYESDQRVMSWASIVGPEGVLWESGMGTRELQTVWSADGTALAVGGVPVWSVVRIRPDGTTSSVAVRVAEDPEPAPSGDPAYVRSESRLPLPIGFSANGRWLFGGLYYDRSPSFRATLRIDLAADPPVVEQIDRLPLADAADRLVSTTYIGETFDPVYGRMAEITYEGIAPRLRIFEPGSEVGLDALDIEAGVQNVTWLGADELLVLVFQPEDPEARVGSSELLRYNMSDHGGTYLAGAGRVNGAWIAGSQAGFALVLFWADEQVEFVMLRTIDGATGSLQARQPEFMSLDLVSR